MAQHCAAWISNAFVCKTDRLIEGRVPSRREAAHWDTGHTAAAVRVQLRLRFTARDASGARGWTLLYLSSGYGGQQYCVRRGWVEVPFKAGEARSTHRMMLSERWIPVKVTRAGPDGRQLTQAALRGRWGPSCIRLRQCQAASEVPDTMWFATRGAPSTRDVSVIKAGQARRDDGLCSIPGWRRQGGMKALQGRCRDRGE